MTMLDEELATLRHHYSLDPSPATLSSVAVELSRHSHAAPEVAARAIAALRAAARR